MKGLLGARISADLVLVHPSERGHLKQVLLKLGWPAEDLAGYVDGEAHAIALDEDGWRCGPTSAGGGGLLARRLRRGGAALRGGQDDRRGGGDGQARRPR